MSKIEKKISSLVLRIIEFPVDEKRVIWKGLNSLVKNGWHIENGSRDLGKLCHQLEEAPLISASIVTLHKSEHFSNIAFELSLSLGAYFGTKIFLKARTEAEIVGGIAMAERILRELEKKLVDEIHACFDVDLWLGAGYRAAKIWWIETEEPDEQEIRKTFLRKNIRRASRLLGLYIFDSITHYKNPESPEPVDDAVEYLISPRYIFVGRKFPDDIVQEYELLDYTMEFYQEHLLPAWIKKSKLEQKLRRVGERNLSLGRTIKEMNDFRREYVPYLFLRGALEAATAQYRYTFLWEKEKHNEKPLYDDLEPVFASLKNDLQKKIGEVNSVLRYTDKKLELINDDLQQNFTINTTRSEVSFTTFALVLSLVALAEVFGTLFTWLFTTSEWAMVVTGTFTPVAVGLLIFILYRRRIVRT